MSFASKLQELRNEYGISQEEFAEMLNVSRQSVSKWERGKGYPELEKLVHISERFRISLDELLKEKTESAPVSGESGETTDVRTAERIIPEESYQEPETPHRTAYPVNSLDEEIYPEKETVYADSDSTPYFRHEVVTDRMPPAAQGGFSHGKTDQNRKGNALKIFITAAALAAGILTGITVSGLFVFSRVRHSDSVQVTLEEDEAAAKPFSCFIGNGNDVIYIVDNSDPEIIITDGRGAEFGDFYYGRDIETGEYVCIKQNLYDYCMNVTRSNGGSYYIPKKFIITSVEPKEQTEYELVRALTLDESTGKSSEINAFVSREVFELHDSVYEFHYF